VSTWSLRRATPADADRLVDFAIAMALETEQKALARETVEAGVRALLDDAGHGECLVAVDGTGAVVGTLSVTYEWSDWRNGVFWWIQSVYVAPEHRRRGVFGALYAELEGRARRAPGVIGLRLYVERDNTRAMATYGALGMRETPYRVYETEFDPAEDGRVRGNAR
jgi:ribosomal protein S18 acetylase RimI-like enzyme